MPITKIPLTHIHLTIHGSRYCIGCEQGEFRFHVWLNSDNLKPENNIIYKNPIAFTPRLQVRRLSLSKGIGKAVGDELLAHAAGLLPGALEAAQAKQQAEKSEGEAALASHRVKEAGPELLDALRSFACLPFHSPQPGITEVTWKQYLRAAQKAIDKATGAAA